MKNSTETTQSDVPQSRKVSPAGRLRIWLLWIGLNLGLGGYFGSALFVPTSTIGAHWLPGKTTHGHYQIELSCDACHSPQPDDSLHSGQNVMQNACIACHGEQLKLAKDTHPASKFNDPVNADRLAIIDAQNCVACHREHVPELTTNMGLTVPTDYCWHCHQDVGKSRPSHQGMAYDSCATAGCHNYHDNRALYEKFLNDHYDWPDHLATPILPDRNFADRWRQKKPKRFALTAAQADAPPEKMTGAALVNDWVSTAHAAAGVNCSGCHQGSENETTDWSDRVSMATCSQCHRRQAESFQAGKHGMRIAVGMSPMTPLLARLPMHPEVGHRELTCNACHSGHRFDTQYAAVDACVKCHADAHSVAYSQSSHATLWRDEQSGAGEKNSGVSCATCHMPRLTDGDQVWVNHDQNASLRPNETMAREVCLACHGLEYSLSALADEELIADCFSSPPQTRIQSVQMAHDWFATREAKRLKRKRNRKQKSKSKKQKNKKAETKNPKPKQAESLSHD